MKIANQLSQLNRYLNVSAQKAPLSLARLQVLQLIKQQNPTTLRQLANTQQVSMPTMSKLMDELQGQGLVIRAQSKDDARQRLIVLTQKGVHIMKEVEHHHESFWKQKFAQLSTEQHAKIEKSLELLLAVLKPKR